MTEIRVLASGLQFPEGPAITPAGELVVTEIAGQKITRIGDDGATSTFADTGGGPNGCAFGPDGALYICDNGGRWPTDMPSTANSGPPVFGAGAILRVDPDGSVGRYIEEVEGQPLSSPNDICFDDRGGFWFTDPVWTTGGMEVQAGSLVHVNADGEARRAHTGLQFPNGLGVTDDGRFLIVCESMTGMMWGFKIIEPGSLRDQPAPTGHIGRRSVPDGFCFDAEGRMIIAGHQTNCLFVLDGRDGRPLDVIELPEQGPTNVCFGGPEFRTMYVTSSDQGNVLALDWHTPGMKLFPDRG